MIAKIRAYINRAFEDVPPSRKSTELQEELISNLMEKFNDQLKLGKTEEEAYTAVISGIGDLSELVDGFRDRQVLSLPTPEERKKNAMFVSSAVMLYILSPMFLILFAEVFNNGIVGLLLMFLVIAAATGLLVYNNISKPKYFKENETLIEEFKEWKSTKDKHKSVKQALSSAFWLITTTVYFLVSFLFDWWAFSWIIFIISAAIFNIGMAIIELRKRPYE